MSVVLLVGADRVQEVTAEVQAAGFVAVPTSTTEEASAAVVCAKGSDVAAVVCALGRSAADRCWPLLGIVKGRPIFSIVLSYTAQRSPRIRLDCFVAGARMVTDSIAPVGEALRRVASGWRSGGALACPQCGLGGLTDVELAEHVAFYHSSEENPPRMNCPICSQRFREPLVVHLHNSHTSHPEPPPAPFPAFAWIICRRPSDGKFLMVNEPAGMCHGTGKPGYWLPAGRVDKGETFEQAGLRECFEEAGVAAKVTGVLQIINGLDTRVLRVALFAEAEAEPKTVPDYESVGAMWVDAAALAELKHDDYRSEDPARYFPEVVNGTLKPISLDTDAWQTFEGLMPRLTRGELDPRSQEVSAAWQAVADIYIQ